MTTSTANTVISPEMSEMLHKFYAIGKRVVDIQNLYGISNTVMNGICTEVKGARASTNTTHVAILALLANN